ncbi:MAG: hypothetical protein J1E16_06405 [Muribaculaceae bacterium]|nr:hypothetical protein [Muribaculaceae bacterium]
MKKSNAKCEFASQRSQLLIKNFQESIARQSKISINKACKDAVAAPAPRFWVSEARATRIVSMIMKGEKVLDGMHLQKRKMYLEIYERVKAKKEANPELPLGDIVFDVVNSPAPSFYITIDYARKLLKSQQNSGKV